jgi:hypothetical protein
MEKSGLPKGLVWQSSARTGGREMNDEDMLEWLQTAEQVEEVLLRSDPAARQSRFRSSETCRQPTSSSSRPTMGVKVHEVDGMSPEISPLRRRAGQPGSPSKSHKPLVFGSGDTPNSKFSFRRKTAISETVEPYQYCGFCKFIIQNARALRLRPPGCTSTGFGIHIEDGDCICCDSNGQQDIDLFPYPHRTLDPVRRSARDGCHLCSILVGRGTPFDDPELGSRSASYGVAVRGRQSYDGPGQIVLERMGSPLRERTSLRTIELQYDLTPKNLSASLKYARTDSQSIYTMAKGWLRQCREHHESCNEITTVKGFLPTRLIKITSVHSDVRSIKLCMTSDLPNHDIPYLALSHRWGGHSTSLASKNYESFIKDIPIRSLPQNFLDAARITANLGFSFLWVDSLCIIQDSPVDKAREIPAMSEIYGHAVLTVAALSAENSNGGCFTSRYPLSLIPALLRDGDSNTRDRVWAEPKKSRGPSGDGDIRPPLHTRGWVVQERALAPRTLNFGADMVHWECVEAVADEASPQLSKDSTRAYGSNSRTAMGVGLKCALDTIRQHAKAGRGYEAWSPFWWRIVREYTASNLTYNSDKWNAIASLAKQAESAVRTGPTLNRLFFGLWGRNLTEELMWKTRKPRKRIDPADFKAPTWSWLSLDTAVIEQHFDFGKVHIRLAKAEADTSGRLSFDGLGATNKAIVYGCLFDLELEINHDHGGNLVYEFQSVQGQGQVLGKNDCAFTWWPDTHLDNNEGLSVLPMMRGKREGDACYGLVVRPSDPAKLSWLRVGCFQLTPVGNVRVGSANHFDGKWRAITLE